jgi:valyl-tRNA synthetase
MLICPDQAKRNLLTEFAGGVQAMVRASNFSIVAEGTVPDDAGHTLVQDVELVVPLKGLIDVEGELEKLAREKGKLDKELARIVGKLGNEKFINNAPAEVVAKERDKEAEIRARLGKNAESTERLSKLR